MGKILNSANRPIYCVFRQNVLDSVKVKDSVGKLVWSEEFDTLDLQRWHHEVNTFPQADFQYYHNSRDNSRVGSE